MKFARVFLAAALVLFAPAVPGFGAAGAAYGDEPAYDANAYIQRIEVVTGPLSSDGVYVGFGTVQFIAIVHMSDGTIAKNVEGNPHAAYADVNWTLARMDGKPSDNCLFSAEGSYSTLPLSVRSTGGDGKQDLKVSIKGCDATSLSVPYGESEDVYRITATSAVADETDAVGSKKQYVGYADWSGTTFYRFQPGAVAVGEVEGRAPSFSEHYDKSSNTYETVLPICSYTAKYYTFAGWEYEGKRYAAGTSYTSPKAASLRFTAAWEPTFATPQGLVAKSTGAGKLALSWGRVLGGGYIVYRKAPGAKKYKKVKTIKRNDRTKWTDTSVSPARAYSYKIAAYRTVGGTRQVTQKSERVIAVTNGSVKKNVFKVVIPKEKVVKNSGKRVKLKAVLRVAGGGVALSSKVRWYSSNTEVATVDKKGKVTLKRKGTCKIWAKAHNGVTSRAVEVTVT